MSNLRNKRARVLLRVTRRANEKDVDNMLNKRVFYGKACVLASHRDCT